MRMIQIQDNISEQKNLKDKLESEQEKLHVEYNKVKTQCLTQSHPSSSPFRSASIAHIWIVFVYPLMMPLIPRCSVFNQRRGAGGGQT